jgi:RimJ/RimL family protein N-acetyltransferase
LQRYANDRLVARYLLLLPHPYTMENARWWIRHTLRAAREREAFAFGIALGTTDEIVGMMTLDRIRWDDRNAELGYWVARRHWGKGVATGAIRLILDFAFRTLRLKRVWADVLAPNIASARVLMRAGFTPEGTFREARRLGRRWVDMNTYGLLREEYPVRRR